MTWKNHRNQVQQNIYHTKNVNMVLETISRIIKVQLPAYLKRLPLPETIGGFARLTGKRGAACCSDFLHITSLPLALLEPRACTLPSCDWQGFSGALLWFIYSFIFRKFNSVKALITSVRYWRSKLDRLFVGVNVIWKSMIYLHPLLH